MRRILRPLRSHAASSAYADPSTCSSCHESIARTYSLTGMGRSFTRVASRREHLASGEPLASITKHPTAITAMAVRDGKFYQSRHQIGFDGQEIERARARGHYVIGSGNHAQTFLHRNADGRLVQMPVSWYAERKGYWAMSPGYDKPAHLDFRRVIDSGCMSCHNGYSRAPVENDAEGPKFASVCPRGSTVSVATVQGRRMSTQSKTATSRWRYGRSSIRRSSIVNGNSNLHAVPPRVQQHPAAVSDSQIRASSLLLHARKSALGLFHPFRSRPGRGRDDKFEIAGGAYRLRKSACFQRSEMTCLTCHNPHDVPRGAKAVDHYVAVCPDATKSRTARRAARCRRGRSASCIDCHMPKRRAEDAVHVVMTDHYIQRQRPKRDLVAARTEAEAQAW